MSEQKQVEKEEDEEDIKPTKENVSDEYLKGYRVGYNRAVKRFKRGKLEIQVKKDSPQTQKKEEEIKKEEVKKDEPKDNKLLWLIVAVVLGVLVFIYVVRTRNNEPTQ